MTDAPDRPSRTGTNIKARIKPMTPGIPHSARVRAHVAAVVISIGLFGLVWRAYALQVDDNLHYRELASRQHGLTVDIPAPRGEVLDTHGRPLAVSADTDSIWANPRDIRDVTATAEKLANLMKVEPSQLEAKLGVDRRFVWIDRHVESEIATAVRAAKLPGIEVAREPRRWYPGRTIGGPVIGRSDIDGKGVDGIELALDAQLTGTRGAGQAVRDARGRRMFAEGMEQPAPGATVTLTLDRTIQALTEQALADAVQSHNANSGVAVVLDVTTGHVLAMASVPTYDPNGSTHVAAARNRGVTDAYEAGSVMKLFSISAALDAGVVSPETEFDVRNPVVIGRTKPIRDALANTYLTTSGVIKRSSNIGTIQIAQRLGRDRLYEALLRFGFGAKTKVELPGEQSGMLRHGSKWREIELATISFGYGLTATPLQIAAGLAAIGNDGLYQPPRIIERVVDSVGRTIERPAVEPRQVISAKTARQMRAMMATTFEGGTNAGTAASIVVPGFRCAGKTGTAHKYDPATKKYSDDHYLSSFAGLAPLVNPRLAIVVIIDDPLGGDYFGGLVAGPVFARVASEALRYLGVPGETLMCAQPPVGGVNPFAVTAAKTCTITPPPPPKPVRVAAVPTAPPAPVEVPEVPDPELTLAIPDFRGMGLRKAIDRAHTDAIAIDVSGFGRVVEQDPPAGLVRPGTRVTLRFSDGDR
ncbi:MAG: penicillin-binding transpeptidase domain-containing protein [Kofleriaceae bacterium]